MTTVIRSVTVTPDALLVHIADDAGRWINVRVSDDRQHQVLAHSPRFRDRGQAVGWLLALDRSGVKVITRQAATPTSR